MDCSIQSSCFCEKRFLLYCLTSHSFPPQTSFHFRFIQPPEIGVTESPRRPKDDARSALIASSIAFFILFSLLKRYAEGPSCQPGSLLQAEEQAAYFEGFHQNSPRSQRTADPPAQNVPPAGIQSGFAPVPSTEAAPAHILLFHRRNRRRCRDTR